MRRAKTSHSAPGIRYPEPAPGARRQAPTLGKNPYPYPYPCLCPCPVDERAVDEHPWTSAHTPVAEHFMPHTGREQGHSRLLCRSIVNVA
ncbi:hypothetical protein GCM10010361_11810 [Streptomyces olivaceiscleroticus]|uniref:Uncharacterized protein n=1 Tax=Streptomyces olivaceiscleroticus TaxID=68245 RepID=A0ABN0ZJB2_9ACTN